MDVDKIRELIDLMTENDLSEIKIIDGETRLLLRRGGTAGQAVLTPQPTVAAAPAPIAAPAGVADDAVDDGGLLPIPAPMVGTFYAAAAPDAKPFVRVGDRVHPETVICIVEAMKVMNDIKAEISGTVEQILVENAKPVEFGQAMFMVRPD